MHRPTTNRPILVTGAHRSGTTWMGAMLAGAPGVGVIHEPFNPLSPTGVCGAPFDRFFRYVCAENEAAYLPHLERTLAFRYRLGAQLRSVRTPRDLAAAVRDAAAFTRHRWRGDRPLLKDPIAVFSAEWIASRLDAEVVVMIRHPAGFASSLKRLDWTHRFEHFVDQPLLLRDHLAPFAGEIAAHAEHPRPVLEQAALLWRAIYRTVLTFQERHPEWMFVRHEDAVRNPLGVYEALYDRLGLRLTGRARRAIAEHTSAGDPADVWRKRLSAGEIAALRAATADVSPAFYGDDEW